MTGLDWLWTYLIGALAWTLMALFRFAAADRKREVRAAARTLLAVPVWPLVLPVVLARGAVWLWRQAFPKEAS